jgi:hypothetical protein
MDVKGVGEAIGLPLNMPYQASEANRELRWFARANARSWTIARGFG